MTRIAIGIVAWLWILALLPAAAGAQQTPLRMSTVVDNMVGEGGDTFEARLLFSRSPDSLCVTIAIPPGPRALNAKLFRFSQRAAGELSGPRLKFPLRRKPRPADEQKRLQVWDGCLGTDSAESPATIEVEYQDRRLLRDLVEHVVAYPAPRSALAVDVLQDSSGSFIFEFRGAVVTDPGGV